MNERQFDEEKEEEFKLGGRTRHVKGRGIYFRIPREERLRAARGVPQAIVKVSSFSRGPKNLADNLRYISRSGEIVLEKDTGEIIQTLQDQKDLIASWSIDFDTRKRSRDASNIIFSMPPGSPVESLKAAVRTTGHRAFPDHEWVFAIHTDQPHPHAHMSLKMRGNTKGKKLELRKGDLRELRSIFAEAAREQGIELACSSRAERGVGRKSTRQPLCHLKKKGIKPEVDKKLRQEAVQELLKNDWTKRPWDIAMEKRNALERKAYQDESRKVQEAAFQSQNQTERDELFTASSILQGFALKMPHAKSKRQAFKEARWREVEQKRQEKQHSKERDNGLEL